MPSVRTKSNTQSARKLNRSMPGLKRSSSLQTPHERVTEMY